MPPPRWNAAVSLNVAIRDVILRDGETLRLRPPVSEDADRLLAFFAGLTPDSLRFRFHGMRAVVPDLVTPFLTTDGNDRGGLIATTADDGDEEVVAVASWARLRDPVCAEVAFAVADEFQGRGVGTRLVEQLAAVAGATGVETFVAEVMPDNRAMLRVFEDAGFDITREIEGGTVEVRFSIEPTERYRERVDERDHVAVVASLRPFFEPSSVAVIGASARPGSIGGTVFRNIRAGGFSGPLLCCQPLRRTGGGCARRPIVERDPRADRPRGHLRAGRPCPRRRPGGAARRNECPVRHFSRLRRDRAGGCGPSRTAPWRSCERTARG